MFQTIRGALRRLRFAAVHGNAVVRAGAGFWLDDLDCNGTESKLTECRQQNTDEGGYYSELRWANRDCIPLAQVGVQCTANTSLNRILTDKRDLTVVEGRSATFKVWLGKAPSADVTVAIAVTDNMPGGTGKADVAAHPRASLCATRSRPRCRSRTSIAVIAIAVVGDGGALGDAVQVFDCRHRYEKDSCLFGKKGECLARFPVARFAHSLGNRDLVLG